MKQTFRFYKTHNKRWYIDIPGWTGSIAELEMVEGADTMLDTVSNHTKECFLKMSDESFHRAEVLKLEHERIQNHGGGGDYILETYESETINHKIWLCEVTRHLFNGLPHNIFFKIIKNGIV
jgi:hypothetical protein